MTQQFQVGDIVYVNPPSQKDLDFLDNIGLGDDIETFVGQYAVIKAVESIDDNLIAISTCDPEYRFKLEDAEELLRRPRVTTCSTHLKFVRPSVLRTGIFKTTLEKPLAGLVVPIAGSRIDWKFVFEKDGYRRTILPDASVDEVFLREDGIGLEFYNYRSTDNGVPINDYVTLTIPAQHIDCSQNGPSQFTTF